MLDITEQPIGYAAAKKRKRLQEAEDAKKTAVEQQVLHTYDVKFLDFLKLLSYILMKFTYKIT